MDTKDFKGTKAELDMMRFSYRNLAEIENTIAFESSLLVEKILKRCKNNTLAFSDHDDDGDNFYVTVIKDRDGELVNVEEMVDSVVYDEEHDQITIKTYDGEYAVWDVGLTYLQLLNAMLVEIEFEQKDE